MLTYRLQYLACGSLGQQSYGSVKRLSILVEFPPESKLGRHELLVIMCGIYPRGCGNLAWGGYSGTY